MSQEQINGLMILGGLMGTVYLFARAVRTYQDWQYWKRRRKSAQKTRDEFIQSLRG